MDSRTLWLWAMLACVLSSQAGAQLITNGGFESGFSGWTRADQVGSDGTFALQSGTTSPSNAEVVPAPPGGSTAAMSDAQGPGSHVLYQIFTVTAPLPTAILSFDLFVGNRSDAFVTPDSLDFSTPALNQQARVDILPAGADPFSVLPADVLMNVFRTNVGDPLVSGYTHYSVDVTALLNSHLNTPLMLRFAETDNVFTFQLGVDNVAVVPEPASWILVAVGLLAVRRIHRRRSLAGQVQACLER